MSVYRPKGSRIYWLDFHFSGQRIRESTGMPSITRAREVENKRRQALRDGAAGIRRPDPPKLFKTAAEDWTETKKAKWSPSMARMAETSLKQLLPVFGRKLLVDIEPRDITRYQQARAESGASGRTVNIEVGILRGVLKRAGLWARIQPHVSMLKERDDVGRALTAAEEKSLLAECGRSNSRVLLPFVVLLIETASRYGTVRRLQWDNVDFESRCLTFGKDKTRAGSGRTIPLMPRALETLRFWAQSFPGRRPSDFVFPHERYGAGFTQATVYDTDPSRPTGDIKTAWQRAKKRTRSRCPNCEDGRLTERAPYRAEPGGFECGSCQWQCHEPPAGVQVRIHDLRHTGVSRMIAARVPLPMIAKIVGWSAGTMARMAHRYGHYGVEEMRDAMAAIGSPNGSFLLGSPKNPPKSEGVEAGKIQ